MEFGCSGNGTMTGLAILLADGNNRGGGDLRSDNHIIGSWSGNKIVITGDYADKGNFTEDKTINLFDECHKGYEDISKKVIEALKDDDYLREELKSSL